MKLSILAGMQREEWALVEPIARSSFLDQIAEVENASLDSWVASRNADPFATRAPFEIANGVGIVSIEGILLKSVPWFFGLFDIAATSYSDIVTDLAQAKADPDVTSILLRVSSPGGQSSGIEEAAAAIVAAGKKKTVKAFVEDIAASGAYWLASQASEISAAANAKAGCIGAYMVITDSSKMAEESGIKVHVIRSGEHKGAGEPGTPVTDEQIAAFQNVIDGITSNFIGAVAKGRGMEKSAVKALADGRVWIAKDAKTHGLIDRVSNMKSALANRPAQPTGGKAMALTPEQIEQIEKDKTAAAVEALAANKKRNDEILAAFPDDKEFAMGQALAGATLTEAKIAHGVVLAGRLKESQAAVKDLKAKAEKAKVKDADHEGSEGIVDDERDEGGTGSYVDQVKALAKEKGVPFRDAMVQMDRQTPGSFNAHKKGLGLRTNFSK